MALQLSVVTIRVLKWSINPISNPNPVYGHSYTLQNVKLKYSLALMGMFSFKNSGQFVKRYHSVVSCALNMDDLISNNSGKLSK
jgi:hypothetical protein